MGSGKTLLLIDDDSDFRASIVPLLEREGYLVLEAESGREGLRLLSQRHPDLIVLDIMLETTEQGYRVLEAIKLRKEYDRYRSIPIIMVSSILDTPDERYYLQADGLFVQPDRYFTKPLDVPAFLEALKLMLGGREEPGG